ncbi:MAG: enoyl-ACP reductase [SAR324 cluster bacterium]|uniref:Enoyl-[acyl-carrier-protein] reductase [NADH] n=1 Tax=SAR324 cluster bacterium TaxID=2024889 RepID=A0A7X9FR18_9DELT|nr:enoyl-ACP reductase [SAR324 cluster bacterium]
MGSFDHKKILILGVANEKSIAHAVLELLHNEGAKIALTYPNDVIEKRLRPIAKNFGIERIFPCDVQSDSDISTLFKELESCFGNLDGLVHSVAFAEREDLQGRFVNTSRSGFRTALDVSVFSLIALAGQAERLMEEKGGSIVTFTYLGSQRVVQNYRVMGVAKAALEASVRYLASELGEKGIRVNAVSAGPIKTLAASGIPQFKDLYSQFEERAPLRRNVSLADVANSAAYFLGPMSAGVTGEIHYVDCGFNIIGI